MCPDILTSAFRKQFEELRGIGKCQGLHYLRGPPIQARAQHPPRDKPDCIGGEVVLDERLSRNLFGACFNSWERRSRG